MTSQKRQIPACLVQYAANWPTSDAGWTTSPNLIPLRAARMLGSKIGEATILELSGYFAPPGTPGNKVGAPRSEILYAGAVVRLLVQDSAGTITQVVNRKPQQFRPIWWGVVVGKTRSVDGGDVTESTYTSAIKTTWICQDAKIQLARTRVCYAYYGSTPQRLDRVIPFNEGGGSNPTFGGNRTANTVTIDGQDVYAFDRSTTSVKWTHRDALDYLLAAYARPQAAGLAGGTGLYGPAPAVGGLTWAIDWTGTPWTGAGTARVPYFDPYDQDIISLMDRLAGSNRGLSWDYSIDGDVATIRFISLSPQVITYGAMSLDANPGITLDHRQNPFIRSMEYTQDSTGYDYILVQGERPLRHVTFAFPGDLIPDDSWTTSSAADDAASPDGLTGAWRTFRISPSWDPGAGAGGTDDPFVRGKISSREDGLPNGFRGYQSGLPVDALDLTPNLGIPAYYGTSSNRSGGEQGPTLLACTTTADATKAEDFSDRIAVAITNAPPVITLGLSPGDSQTIKSWYDGRGSHAAFYLTVGVREWAPLSLAWCRESRDWPNGNPRVLCHRIPDAIEVSRSNGVRMSVNSSGTIQGNAAGSTIFDGSSMNWLYMTLALLRARYEVEGGTIDWTEGALIDSTTALGTMIETLEMPDQPATINAVISSISWDFTDSTTGYTTERPDFQASK